VASEIDSVLLEEDLEHGDFATASARGCASVS